MCIRDRSLEVCNIEQRQHGELLYILHSSNSMIASNHHRPGKRVWRGELGASISALLLIFPLFVVAVAPGQTSPPAAGKTVQSGTAPVTGTPSSDVSKYV